MTIIVTCLLAVPAAQADGSRVSGRDQVAGHSAQAGQTAQDSRPETCRSARRGLRWYQRHEQEWRNKMGAGEWAGRNRLGGRSSLTCPRVRHLAKRWREKARAARIRYASWRDYHYAWWKWLPAKHQRVAACETGHQGGTGPGGSRWDWDSRHFDANGRFLGGYVSAFGIYGPGYDDDAHRVGNLGWDETIRRLGRYPTPREQMQAVDSHRAAHGGWSGWGCRGA